MNLAQGTEQFQRPFDREKSFYALAKAYGYGVNRVEYSSVGDWLGLSTQILDGRGQDFMKAPVFGSSAGLLHPYHGSIVNAGLGNAYWTSTPYPVMRTYTNQFTISQNDLHPNTGIDGYHAVPMRCVVK